MSAESIIAQPHQDELMSKSPTIYSPEQLQEKYAVSPEEANRIVGAVGNARNDIDPFMLVYRNRRQVDHFLDVSHPTTR